jgi:DNA adenine methylase
MKYPGGKNAAGTYQRIINQIPPHRVYIEPFGGSAAILRFKLPAERSIVLDLEPGALDALGDRVPPGTELLEADALEFLKGYRWVGDEFVYCDPPYLPEACRSRIRYRHKMSERQHRDLLTILLGLPCNGMISGYKSELYNEMLAGWRTDTFPQMTRGGYCIDEWLWMNYPAPTALHDYRYLGSDYREREKFSRRRKRWTAKLSKMAPIERQALLAALQEVG